VTKSLCRLAALLLYVDVGRSQSSTSSLPVMSTPSDYWRTTSCRSLGNDSVYSPTSVRLRVAFSCWLCTRAYPSGYKGFIPPKLPKFHLTTDEEYVANLLNANNVVVVNVQRCTDMLYPHNDIFFTDDIGYDMTG